MYLSFGTYIFLVFPLSKSQLPPEKVDLICLSILIYLLSKKAFLDITHLGWMCFCLLPPRFRSKQGLCLFFYVYRGAWSTRQVASSFSQRRFFRFNIHNHSSAFYAILFQLEFVTPNAMTNGTNECRRTVKFKVIYRPFPNL